jgi:WS/DGAT/MGAT family acyltransferase
MTDETPFPRRMGPVDAMFWRLEEERALRSPTLAVTLLDRAPDREALRDALRRASRRMPRLRQRVIELPALLSTPVWSADPDFAIDDHLRWLGPLAGGERELLELAASMAMRSFDRARPLWEFAVVEALDDGRAALIQKLHHSVGDGAAGLALMAELFSDTRELPPRAPEPEPAPEPEEQPLDLAREALRTNLRERPRARLRMLRDGIAALRDPVESARRTAAELRAVGGFLDSGPGPLSPIMKERSSRSRFGALVLPNEPLKAAAKSHGCGFNAALLAGLVGGLARYHEACGASVPALRGAIPVSQRTDDEVATSGNRLAIARFSAPLDEPDPVLRMRALQSRVAEQRAPASLGAFEVIANLVNVTPPPLVVPLVLAEMRKSDFVATSLPGPAAPLYLAGSRVESLFPFGPTAGAALNLTLVSYAGDANVGVTVDPAAVTDFGGLLDCLQLGFEEILALA